MTDFDNNPFFDATAEDAAPPLGAIISERWELVEHIGEGGMSNVYKARHVIMQKFGAVKFLKGSLAEDPVAVKRFQQEALTAGNLSHPNIVQMYDCGLCEYGCYLIMEILPGVSLFEIMDARATHAPDGLGIFRLDEALPIFLQICDGLEHAHKKGIIHRDIKPSNIMLLEQEDPDADNPEQLQVKLVDFGLAKMIGRDGTTQDGKLTATGEVFGSPVYMSPEHCLGKRLDGRSDIYSLGCLMYECVTGRKVLVGLSTTETMMRHVEEDADLRGLLELKDPLARQLGEIIEKCLQRNAAMRYNDVGELRAALKELESDAGKKKTREVASATFKPLPYILSAGAVLAASVLAIALYSVWPVQAIAAFDATPIIMPVKTAEKKKSQLNPMSPKLFHGGESVVAHLQLSPETKVNNCKTVLKRADSDLAGKHYDDALKRYEFVYQLLSDTPDRLPSFNDLQLHALVGKTVAQSEMKDLDGLDIGLGNLIKSEPTYFNASNDAKRFALQWRARAQKDNGSYAAAATTIGQMLELYPDYSGAHTLNDPEEVVQKALWTGLLADLLRLTDDRGRQSKEMFDHFGAALATLNTAPIADPAFAQQVETYRARLNYRYGVALAHARRYPEAYEAFQQSLALFAAQGTGLVSEVEAARIESYLALRNFNWWESLKYRLQNHV
jgi:serine/threonine protein kinase